MFDLVGPRHDPVDGPGRCWSMWRYRRSLPEPASGLAWEKTTLGEGMTPLVEVVPGVLAKLEYVSPTGSFKDRGAAMMLALAAAAGRRTVVADSSGNAGKAVAVYAAKAGMSAEVFVPAGTPEVKTSVARASGALVIEVEGGREATARAAMRRVEEGGGWYASHVYQASFVHGVKTIAFEIFEQLAGRAPGTVVVPAGNGTLVQGTWLGFSELRAFHGGRLPQLVAVQSDRFAALAGASPSGDPTVASGIAIDKPARLEQVRAALMASGGRVVSVPEDAIVAAGATLARAGLLVEPTAAAAWAGFARSAALPEPVVVVLSGR